MNDSRLYDDVHAADIVVQHSTDLVSASEVAPEVAAVERGLRQHPNGTTEDYQRIEYR